MWEYSFLPRKTCEREIKIMPDFATLLSEHIHNKNIKTYALAQYCNLDRSNMYKIIKGQRKPSSLEMVEKMCKFMHLSPSEQADMEESYHIALIGRENYYRRKPYNSFLKNSVFRHCSFRQLHLPMRPITPTMLPCFILILRSIARSFTSSPRN